MGLYSSSKDKNRVIEGDTKGKSAVMKELETQTESSSSSVVNKIELSKQKNEGNAKNDTELIMRIESKDNKKSESKIQTENKGKNIVNKPEIEIQKENVYHKEITEIQLERSEVVDEGKTEADKKKTKSKWYSFGIEEDRDPKNINGNLKVYLQFNNKSCILLKTYV